MTWTTRALAALLLVALAGQAQAGGVKVGKPAPDFKLETFDGRRLTLADFKGKVVVLNFWATWCTPCRREMPLLDGYARVQQSHGLQVLAIATEGSVPEDKLKPIAELVSFPLVRRITGPYRVLQGVPTNYVIDKAGVVRWAKAGAFDLDALNQLLIPLLNEPAPADTTIAAAPAAKAGG